MNEPNTTRPRRSRTGALMLLLAAAALAVDVGARFVPGLHGLFSGLPVSAFALAMGLLFWREQRAVVRGAETAVADAAPVAAASTAPECRRSCQRRSSRPAATRALYQWR